MRAKRIYLKMLFKRYKTRHFVCVYFNNLTTVKNGIILNNESVSCFYLYFKCIGYYIRHVWYISSKNILKNLYVYLIPKYIVNVLFCAKLILTFIK